MQLTNRNFRLSTAATALLLAVGACLLAGCGGGGGAQASPLDPTDTIAAMLTVINNGRTNEARPTLAASATLNSVAQAHATYLASIGALQDDNAAGKGVVEQVQDAGYLYDDVSSVFGTATSRTQMYATWRGDAGAIERIQRATFSQIGIGMASTTELRYWVVIVGDPQ